MMRPHANAPRRASQGAAAALAAAVLAFLPLGSARPAPAVAPAAPAQSSIAWIGRHAEFERFLKEAGIVRTERISTGVTGPRHVFFAPGGPAGGAVIKAIRPTGGAAVWDSYRSEIAAYELDKLLAMDMVPPTVEREVGRNHVSVQLWVEGCQTYKTVFHHPRPNPEAWNRQIRRMLVFDNLIVNKDRNEGNMLIDPSYALILIDHSRTFDGRTPLAMPYEKQMTAIDRAFFEKLKALDRQALLAHVDPWVDFGVAPILRQRDAIVRRFEQLIREKGEANVIVG